MPNPGEAPPTFRTINWLSEVTKSWNGQYYAADVAYEFSNGRKFQSTDKTSSGIYSHVPSGSGDLVWP